jgi:hypothetical protein
MCKIGLNTSGIDSNLNLGKEIGKFGKELSDKAKAQQLAKVNEGSEIIYKAEDGTWHVNELEQEGIIYDSNDVSLDDKSEITLDQEQMKKSGVANAVISFVEEKSDYFDNMDVSQDPTTGPEILAQLSHVDGLDENNKDYVKGNVAGHHNTSPETLEDLADYDNPVVRERVGRNHNTTVETLQDLSEDKKAEVRSAVAGNPNTPVAILKNLATDLNPAVRAEIARNPNTPVEILKEMCFDTDGSVRKAVASNTKVPVSILTSLKNDKDFEVIIALAGNKNTPENILNDIEKNSGKGYGSDSKKHLYRTLIKNPSTPEDALKDAKVKLKTIEDAEFNEFFNRVIKNNGPDSRELPPPPHIMNRI